jgi:hypothetical protein
MPYIQYDINGQAAEPYFTGAFYINLGHLPSAPNSALVTTKGGNKYSSTTTRVQFYQNNPSDYWTWMMAGPPAPVPYQGTSSSIKDFPFDSGRIDLETKFDPPLPIAIVMIRNYAAGFYIPCSEAQANRDAEGKIHLSFAIRRNRLVQFTAVTLLLGLSLFAFVIPLTVKQDALATSVASFFFSLWSIRTILTPEPKVFPTLLDLLLLLLCVLILLLLMVKLLLLWIKPTT